MKRIRLSPAQIFALGFALVILLGSGILSLPCCIRDGVAVPYIDTLYTSTSAVCVTGLLTVDCGTTYTPLGQLVIAVLIQIGGLGVASIGAGVILAMRKKLGLRGRYLIRESSNLTSGKGIVRFVRSVFLTTVIIELGGAVLSLPVFLRDYPPLHALGLSLFHSVAAFNNSGFDILGLGNSLGQYTNDVMLNLVTCGLIILGGIGFLVIREVLEKRFRWRKLSFHARVVLFTSGILTLGGTILFLLTENMTFLQAFFNSVTARTAGFATVPLSSFTNAGLLVMIVLMIIGASPGSTGGGIKTTTVFALMLGIRSAATGKSEQAFRYRLPADAFRKAAVVTLMAVSAVCVSTFLLMAMDPAVPFRDALFEMSSAFGTVGLSTGITPSLSLGSKLLSILLMFTGRLGPLTIASLWYFTPGERVGYAEGELAIG